ncbi:hypothetical protein JCM3774_000872 [Rhodotorula dairenensis]
MPPRRSVLPPPPTAFFPSDPSYAAADADLSLPVPPIEFTQADGRGGPGPSLAHRLASSSATPLEPQSLARDLDLRVTNVGGSPSTSTANGKRRRNVPRAIAAETGSPGRLKRGSLGGGTAKRKSKTTEGYGNGKGKAKAKGKDKAVPAAELHAQPTLQRTPSSLRDIRVHPSSSSSSSSSNANTSEVENETDRSRPKKRRRSAPASTPDDYDDDGGASDVYTDDDDDDDDEEEESSSDSSDDDDDDDEASDPDGEEARLERREPGGSWRRRRRQLKPSRAVGSLDGGPGYEGFAGSRRSGGGSVPALKTSTKVVPPLVPRVLRGSDNLKALLLASFDDQDEHADEDEAEFATVDHGVGAQLAGVASDGNPKGTRPKLTAAQLAELERASDPYVRSFY